MKMKKNKGMLTIEAALIMPLVIYIVFIMISVFLLIYTRTYVSLSTNHSTILATSQWYNIDESKSSVIGSIIGTSLSTGKKVKDLEGKIKTKIENGSPIKIESLNVKVTPKNYIIGQKLEINVESSYRVPLSGLFKLLGISSDGTFKDTYTKVVNLSNPEESMRTITYASKILGPKATEILDKIEEELIGGR